MSIEKKGIFLSILVMMSAVGLLASDICLPALPEMAIHFDCQQTDIQSSLTIFLCALAACQLVYGNLSDRFGRKIILIFGFSLFIIASVLSANASTLTQFIVCIALQAIGAGVGSVLSRAIIVDRFNKLETIKIFTTIFPVVGLSPAIAPFIGGYLTHFFDWRASFYFMALFGSMVLILIMVFFEEKPSVKQEETLDSYGYTDIFKNISFLGYACILCVSYAVFRCYTTESPFIFDNQGFVAREIGCFYITLSLAYVVGNLGAKKLVKTLSIDQALSVGFLFFVLGGLSLVGSSYLFASSPLAIIVPMSIVTIGNGFLFPIGSAAALSSVPSHFSGGASGLLGSLQLSVAALGVYFIGAVSDGRAFFMALYLLAMISCGLFSFMVVRFSAKSRD